MESLYKLRPYFQRLHSNKFNDFLEIFNSIYTNTKNLNKKLEFSLLLDPKEEFDLRFGLFQIYSLDKIISIFKTLDHDTSNLESSLLVMQGFAPEHGLGFDWNQKDPRIKTYFLRLPDNPLFEEEISRKINELAELNNINSEHLKSLSKNNCYLIGVDSCFSKKNNLKIYCRNSNVNFLEVNKKLKKSKINSKYFLPFIDIFSEKDFHDVTYSYKYSHKNNSLSGISIFFEVKPHLNEKISMLIKSAFPVKAGDFRRIIDSLSSPKSIDYTYIGMGFLTKPQSEHLSLYFSPSLGV